ncbi:lysozyme inhibitor LprI family protein [Brucella intermedia]
MKIAILTVAAILAFPSFASAKDKCASAQDQATMNACADASSKQSDKKLNNLYRQIEDRLNDDADTKKFFVQAQREWIKFRDAECNFQTAGSGGGSMMPMLVAQCVDSLTKSRVKDFEGYLRCEEGDMSCPVPAGDATPVADASATTMPATSSKDMGFDVNVTLSNKAAARLAANKEGIVVFASYYGDPKKSAEKHTNEIGQISVSSGDESVEISGAGGIAHVSGTRIDTKSLDWVAGQVKVNVNVASARKSSSDNLLECDLIDGPVSNVRKAAPVEMHCYLIDEKHPDTRLRP